MLMWQLSEGMANVDTWITHCNVMLNIGYHLPDIADKMNPFTPTSDWNFKFPQPGASEILHYTVWRTGLSIVFTPMKDGYATDSHYNPYTFLLERLGELRFELGNKRVNSLFFFTGASIKMQLWLIRHCVEILLSLSLTDFRSTSRIFMRNVNSTLVER